MLLTCKLTNVVPVWQHKLTRYCVCCVGCVHVCVFSLCDTTSAHAVFTIWLELKLQPVKKRWFKKREQNNWTTFCQEHNGTVELVHLALCVPHTTNGPLTSCCFQRIPARPSLCCCHWNFQPTRVHCSHCHGCRCHDSHCRVTLSRCRWTRCSSSPRPPRWASKTCCSCGGCAARPRGPGRCCRCPPMGGLARLRPGCSPQCGAVVPWSCSPTLPWAWSCMGWTLCTLRFPLHPPAPGSNTAWSLNLLTLGESSVRAVFQGCGVDERWVTPFW